MADVPKAREILNDTLTKNMSLEVREGIEQALSYMYRDYSLGRKAPVKSRAITDGLRQSIKQYAATHPTLSMQDIATAFKVNAGRVSEILRDIK
jgi:hypothetical protein